MSFKWCLTCAVFSDHGQLETTQPPIPTVAEPTAMLAEIDGRLAELDDDSAQ